MYLLSCAVVPTSVIVGHQYEIQLLTQWVRRVYSNYREMRLLLGVEIAETWAESSWVSGKKQNGLEWAECLFLGKKMS